MVEKEKMNPGAKFPGILTGSENSLLEGLSDTERDVLNSALVPTLYKKKEIIVTQGETVRGIYCVRSGAVKIMHTDAAGNQGILNIMCAGELFGFTSLWNVERSPLAAVALHDSEVALIEKEKFLTLVDRYPRLARNLISHLARDRWEFSIYLFKHLHLSVPQRIAEVLLTYYEKSQRSQPQLVMALKRDDLADWAGTSLESAVRCLSEFKRQGIVKANGRIITILKPEVLERLSGRRKD